jgi:hypothetical protein
LTIGVYYHLGIAVRDLEAAMADLGRSLGLHWTSIEGFRAPEGQVRFCYSREGPPHLELLEGPAGTVWDSTAGDHMHHVGYWSTDIAADRELLHGRGMPLELDGATLGRGFTYHHDDHGLRVELIDGRNRGAIEAWIGGAPLTLRSPEPPR